MATWVERFHETHALLNLRDGGGPDVGELKIPQGVVLALGDRRGGSFDRRSFGLLAEEDLYGRALGSHYRRGTGLVWLPF